MTTTGQMVGKICMVTGGTSGIGAVASRELAGLGATVIVVGRDARKCARQVEHIKRTFPQAQLDFLRADLSSQKEVKQLAEEFKSRYSRIDVLINNAGACFSKRKVSPDGLELTFALNHMGYFLLTHLLLDQLKASTSARIVIVSSNAHKHGKINFDDLQTEHNYDLLKAYGQSKLANLLFTYALARRLQGTRVTANALHPGWVATNFNANNNWLKTKLAHLLKRGMISPEDGAKTMIYLATSPDVQSVSGKYFYECKSLRSSDESYSEADAEKLWRVSETLAGIRSEPN